MEIEVFASLKQYFPSRFTLEEDIRNVEELLLHLKKINPEAGNVLDVSRFAVMDTLVEAGFLLKKDDHVGVLPPSSGG